MHDRTITGYSSALCRRALFRLALLAGLLGLPACANYRITVPDSDPSDIEYQERTIHAYFWGSVVSPLVLAAECEGEGINDVVINQSYAHDLASVLTLGIWMPMDVRFRCIAPGSSGGVFPSPFPD